MRITAPEKEKGHDKRGLFQNSGGTSDFGIRTLTPAVGENEEVTETYTTQTLREQAATVFVFLQRSNRCLHHAGADRIGFLQAVKPF
jgi:hypothetical protein